ncbi:site-specific integrase, partial [Streptomyces albiflaviniger]|nr:site-specific integrase [Streptomyces albiflaviniger]
MDLRRRPPLPRPQAHHRPPRRLPHPRRRKGGAAAHARGRGRRVHRRPQPDRRRLPHHLARGEGVCAQADDRGPVPGLRHPRPHPRARRTQAGRARSPPHRTPQETVRFLDYCHDADPLIANLCELLIGTGMRKGEALGLHWADVHPDEQVLYVRYALSAINNSRLVITTPKTRASKNWITLSPRVIRVLEQRATETRTHIDDPSDLFTGLAFCRPDGRPLRPQTVLDRFRKCAKEAGVPRITLHDLRHLAAPPSPSPQ